jgi:hypothetical protein
MRVLNKRSLLVVLLAASVVIAGQTRQFTRSNVEYVLELPSPAWQVTSRVDVHDHPEFINGGDPANGYLRLRKIFVDQSNSISELFASDEKWELKRLPGYVACSDCQGIEFKGRLNGAVYSYEYVAAGRTMHGRIYYLRVDQCTYYSLHFTVKRTELAAVRNEMESIAGSFHLK